MEEKSAIEVAEEAVRLCEELRADKLRLQAELKEAKEEIQINQEVLEAQKKWINDLKAKIEELKEGK